MCVYICVCHVLIQINFAIVALKKKKKKKKKCWQISVKANNPSCTFCVTVDRLLKGHVNGVTKYVTLAHLTNLTLCPPFLRISSAPGWATGRFKRDVVHKKVPGIVVVFHHNVKRTHFLQA